MPSDPFAQEQAARKTRVINELATHNTPTGACGCSRELRLLSIASDAPKCAGCGYVSGLCTCKPPGEEPLPWYRTHPLIGDQPDKGATEP